MGSSNTLGFIAIIILLLSSINASAQDTLTYDLPESGTKIHIAEKLVNFKDGYHYKAVRADYMKAAIDELQIDDESEGEVEVTSSSLDFSSGNLCSMMDILAMAGGIDDIPSGPPTNKSFTEIVSDKYPNLTNVTVADLLDLAENYEYEGVSDILKSVVDLENPTLIDEDLEVGKIQGQASVTPNGSFTYSIPIMLPPGSGGMQPQVSLNYNHLAGNGHLGYGWNMSGVSAIRHGNNDYFHDSKTDAGGFDNWVFELDGQRLFGLIRMLVE